MHLVAEDRLRHVDVRLGLNARCGDGKVRGALVGHPFMTRDEGCGIASSHEERCI